MHYHWSCTTAAQRFRFKKVNGEFDKDLTLHSSLPQTLVERVEKHIAAATCPEKRKHDADDVPSNSDHADRRKRMKGKQKARQMPDAMEEDEGEDEMEEDEGEDEVESEDEE